MSLPLSNPLSISFKSTHFDCTLLPQDLRLLIPLLSSTLYSFPIFASIFHFKLSLTFSASPFINTEPFLTFFMKEVSKAILLG